LDEQEAQLAGRDHQLAPFPVRERQPRAAEELLRAREQLAFRERDREAHRGSPFPKRTRTPSARRATARASASPSEPPRAASALRGATARRPWRSSSNATRSRPSMKPTAGKGRPKRASSVSYRPPPPTSKPRSFAKMRNTRPV